jgi:hypothetical protein
MLLRSGNAGSSTVCDHITVLLAALAQIPGSSAAKILVRVDGAGATHDLLAHLEALNTTRRTVPLHRRVEADSDAFGGSCSLLERPRRAPGEMSNRRAHVVRRGR